MCLPCHGACHGGGQNDKDNISNIKPKAVAHVRLLGESILELLSNQRHVVGQVLELRKRQEGGMESSRCAYPARRLSIEKQLHT